MTKIKEALQSIPSVDKILKNEKIQELSLQYPLSFITYIVRKSLKEYRLEILEKKDIKEKDLLKIIIQNIHRIANKNLKSVINASGVIIHTNLGRAPLGKELIENISETLYGYTNLEFDLKKGKRGDRNSHARELLKYLSSADDILIVNNNAAAVMLLLRTFAKDKEVIVSRGELIEIGGAFRVPDIMAASDCKMVEVGTTNKTKINDYKNAINKETALLFKTHPSNYIIKGFTAEVSLKDLVSLGKKSKIPVVYDIGSGLIRKIDNQALQNEPNVREALETGIDLISFSGDKLLGGPQAGIIAGKQKYIDILKKEPMMRALRVGKLTLAALETACLYYLNDKDLFEKNKIFKTLNQKTDTLKKKAEILQKELAKEGIGSSIEKSFGKYGGGTLPDAEIPSFSVKLKNDKTAKERSIFSEKCYHQLLQETPPILSILKKGHLYFDVLTIDKNDLSYIAQSISKTTKAVTK